MTDGTASGTGGRPSSYSGSVPRRLSYASVASGAPPAARSGGFAHLTASTATSSFPPQYPSDYQHQRRPSTQEQDMSTSGGSGGSSGLHWRKPGSLPSYSRKFANIPPFGLHATAPNPFFVPSYLRHSRYVAKLEAAHKAKVKRERELALGPSQSNSTSLSAGVSNTNVHRIAPSHRGMTYDIIESNPPQDEDQLMPLPSRWNEQDRYPGLDVLNDGLELRYSGSASKADIEAASVRADYPMSPACGIYYFEVEIKQKSKDTAVAIGFSTAEASLERLPGWETHSWGYHGDDGKMFFGEHSGRSYGPTFGVGDVIGCGINFNAGHAFFTKNGKDLGICFRELKNIKPFPSVGMKKYSGALVGVNFGQRPFVFDIEEKILAEQDSVNKEIAKTKTSTLRPPLDESSLIQELVAQFLAHDGYVETARAFAEEVRREKQSLNNALPAAIQAGAAERDDTDAVHRQRIRRAILSGDIDEALEVTHAHFPSVLSGNPQIVFRLKCRKWVELISKMTELNARKPLNQASKNVSNGFGRDSAVEDSFAQEMELDEQQHGDNQLNGTEKATNAENAAQYDRLINEAMEYGQNLQREYRDEDGEYAKTLQDIFSLVAYNDPKGSVHGHLLDPSGRVAVAEELNSAILVSLGRSPSAALEKTWKQTEAMIDLLSEEGGPAAFVNLQASFSS